MSNAIWEVQKSIYKLLSFDHNIQSYIGSPARIFDYVPESTLFPFLTLGETRVSDWQGIDGGLEHDLRLYAFSRYGGRKEVKNIVSLTYQLLHEARLTVNNHNLVNIRMVFSDVWRRQDRETYQGVMRFRAVTEPSA